MSAKAICPVMNTLVDTKAARSQKMVREFQGKKYYLCCKICVKLFDKNSAKYAAPRGGEL